MTYIFFFLTIILSLTPFQQTATRDERWQEDLAYLAEQLPTLHVDAFHTISENEFHEQVAALESQIPELTDAQIMVEISRLVASIGDGHTTAILHTPQLFHIYPVGLGLLDDTLFVITAPESEQDILGGEVISIGETSVEEAIELVSPLISRDNDQQLSNQLPLYLRTPEVLAALGILPDDQTGTFTILTPDGETREVTFAPVAVNDTSTRYVSWFDVAGIELPISQTRRGAYYWYNLIGDTLFFQYNRCADAPDFAFTDFNDSLFETLETNPVERIVIDLRYNSGGNSAILHPFIEGLKDHPLNEEGKVFVLIGRSTFSSAVINAIELDQQTEAILVGEPTGGKPNHYGEIKAFALPNSGIQITYSTRFWELVPGDDSLAVEPEMSVAFTVEDFLEGRDVVLEAVLEQE